MNRTTKLLLAGLTAALLSACGSNVKLEDTQQTAAPVESRTTDGQAGGADASGAGSRGVQQVTLGDKDPLNDPASPLARRSIYFDFDSYALRPDALETLKHNAEVINANPGPVIIQVAGNCDERGTQEYNLALGEKRALAARDYLIQLGVPADRVITISYGEENPANPGHDEAAWAQNRRDDFLQGRM